MVTEYELTPAHHREHLMRYSPSRRNGVHRAHAVPTLTP